ncbi:MAG: helix-turn-helix transcriptional regulator [Dermabacter sp.]|nr:helix-turn-helix transcriptional regulator [Dermabacter sp.]
MSAERPNEDDEWVAHRIDSWVETYKKAMLTPVVLRLVAMHQPVMVATLTEHLTAVTGWQVTERGLYRTVKRLQDIGYLTSENVAAPRTGAKRKELALTSLGEKFLSGIDANLIDLGASGFRSPDGGAPAPRGA